MESYGFEREFTLDGEVISAPDGHYITRKEAAQMAELARKEGAEAANAETGRLLAEIVARLTPIEPVLTGICEQLRREAVELAMTAIEAVAGAALSVRASEAVAEAIREQTACLQKLHHIEVWVRPECRKSAASLLKESIVSNMDFFDDPDMGPGDWRIVWDEGEISFDAAKAIEELDKTVRRHLEEPCQLQGDLFAPEQGEA